MLSITYTLFLVLIHVRVTGAFNFYFYFRSFMIRLVNSGYTAASILFTL